VSDAKPYSTVVNLYWLLTAHCACGTTVILNGKFGNTTYISKIWPESKKNRFSRRTPHKTEKKQI